MTKPSAPSPKGRVPVAESAPIFAELDERVRPHVAVDAAGDDGVAVPRHEHVHRGVEGGEGRGAGGVGGEVRPAQVEDVGHAAGEDVRELTGHRVLGDLGQLVRHDLPPAREDGPAHAGRQVEELLRFEEQPLVFGERDAQGGQVVALPRHRVAEDDRRAVGVELLLRVAVVGESLGGDGDRPLLPLVHRPRHPRRDVPALPVELEAAHPTSRSCCTSSRGPEGRGRSSRRRSSARPGPR